MKLSPWVDIVMCLALIVSAMAVSWSVHESRRLTNDAQRLQAEHNRLHTEWSQLLLEHSTWGAYARVESLARSRLSMSLPETGQQVMVRP